jgi:transcriptional regulator with XRE-family HTH domain
MNYCQGEKVYMNENSPRERIIQFRNFLGQSQEEFSKEFGMSQSNISKIESGLVEVSDTLLYALMGRFAANPEWFKTGEGEMFLSSKEYLCNGIVSLGAEKIGEGLVEILKDPAYGELKSLIAVGEMVKEKLDPDLAAYLQYILNKWQQGDENIRGWLKIQLDSVSKGKRKVNES